MIKQVNYYLYTQGVESNDFILMDVGNGPFIFQWNVDNVEEPTAEMLNSIVEDANAYSESIIRKEFIVSELARLDEKLRRDVEDLAKSGGITLSDYLESIRAEKEELREKIHNESIGDKQ